MEPLALLRGSRGIGRLPDVVLLEHASASAERICSVSSRSDRLLEGADQQRGRIGPLPC